MVGVAEHTERGNAWSRSWPDDKEKESATSAILVMEFVSVVTMAWTLGWSTPGDFHEQAHRILTLTSFFQTLILFKFMVPSLRSYQCKLKKTIGDRYIILVYTLLAKNHSGL